MSIIDSIGGRFLSAIKNTCILLTWLAGIILIISAYCGYFDPKDSSKLAIIGMIFPIALAINIAILFLWIIARKISMIILGIIFLGACFNQINTFSPFNMPDSDVTSPEGTFKVLTYNVMNFNDNDSLKDSLENRTLRYILDKDADIVLLQEGSAKIKMDKNEKIKSLMPELKKKYPYRERRLKDLVILSKHPYQIDNENITSERPLTSTAYRLEIDGKTLYIINVHLESLHFNESDKALYRSTTDFSKITDNLSEKTVKDVKNTLLSKLSVSFKKRATQAEDIKKYINNLNRHIDGENVIICGDFNDTPSSYSYLTIKGDDMKDAYEECALGPTITFHASRFYFRIDHVLYKGNFEAIDIERGDQKSSDHYPLLTTFKWK